jgi:hypothetical protein
MTLNEFGDYILNSFRKLSSVEQEQVRKEMYGAVTRRPYRAPKENGANSDQRDVSVVSTPYDYDFLRSAGIFVSARESSLALLLDERFAGPDAFDRRLTEDDLVFLRAVGVCQTIFKEPRE